MKDRQSNNVFVSTWIATGYVWNSDHIDKTDILHSTVAISRKLKFLIGISLSALYKIT